MPEQSRQHGGLIIVQNRETQFDAPLYRQIHQQQILPLQVVYTMSGATIQDKDAELGFEPQWDHLTIESYLKVNLANTSPRAIWTLSRTLRRQSPALVLICGYYPRLHLLLALFLRLQGQRIGLRSDNTLTHTSFTGLKGRIRRTVVGWIQRLFDSWHPVGAQAHTYLSTISGASIPSFRFAYAVDNDWFAQQSSAARPRRAQFLAEQGWPEDAVVVLGILKWHAREDPLTLIRGFALLQARCPQARLVLVGDGPLRDAVMQAVAPLEAAIHCPGYVAYSQLPHWYAMADVFVHPSPDEPWGVSVNEAMACGLPVITARGVGAAHELIVDGVNGRIVADRDPEALAAALEALLNNHDLRQRMGARCRTVIEGWSYRQTIEAFQQALAH